MVKQDEIDFFNYLYTPNGMEVSSTMPGRDKIEAFPNMSVKRKYYILEKWFQTDIWEVGISNFCGWFLENSKELFDKKVKENNVEKLYAHMFGFQLGFIVNNQPNTASGRYIAEYELRRIKNLETGEYEYISSFLNVPKKHMNLFYNNIRTNIEVVTNTLIKTKKDLIKLNGLKLSIINVDEQIHHVLKKCREDIRQLAPSVIFYYLKVDKLKVLNMYKAYFNLQKIYLNKHSPNYGVTFISSYDLGYNVKPNIFTNTLNLLNRFSFELGIDNVDISEIENIEGFKIVYYGENESE